MTITVKIPKKFNASISMEVDGVKGQGCLASTLALRKQLVGTEPLKRKDEFDQRVDDRVCANA